MGRDCTSFRVNFPDILGSLFYDATQCYELTQMLLKPCRLACKEMDIGGYRGWRLKVLEAFIIILTFTQLLYVLLLHAGMFSSKYGPGYRDREHAMGPTTVGEHEPKGSATGVTGSRV
jgi:hypothetical protein